VGYFGDDAATGANVPPQGMEPSQPTTTGTASVTSATSSATASSSPKSEAVGRGVGMSSLFGLVLAGMVLVA